MSGITTTFEQRQARKRLFKWLKENNFVRLDGDSIQGGYRGYPERTYYWGNAEQSDFIFVNVMAIRKDSSSTRWRFPVEMNGSNGAQKMSLEGVLCQEDQVPEIITIYRLTGQSFIGEYRATENN